MWKASTTTAPIPSSGNRPDCRGFLCWESGLSFNKKANTLEIRLPEKIGGRVFQNPFPLILAKEGGKQNFHLNGVCF
jgi:hypothetical protein